MLKPIGPVLAVTRKENAILQESRLHAQRDLLERLGADKPDGPVAYSDVAARLVVHERAADGSVLASIYVGVAGQRHRYVRSLRVVTGEGRGVERPVDLRVGR